MKQQLLVLIAFLCAVNLHSQENKIIESHISRLNDTSNELEPFQKTTFQYNDQGEEIRQTVFHYQEGSYSKSWEKLTEYSNAKKSKETKVFYTSTSIDQVIEYSYFDNDCLQQISKRYLKDNGEVLQQMLSFYNETSCRLDSSLTAYEENNGDLLFLERKEYEYFADLEIISHFRKDEFNIWTYIGQDRIRKNADGLVLEWWTDLSDFAKEEERIYIYDDQQSKIQEDYLINLSGIDELRLVDRTIWQNEYRENNDLKQRISKQQAFNYYTGQEEGNWKQTETFDYYCDDLLQGSSKTDFEGQINEVRQIFYQTGTNCEENTAESILLIYPNPTLLDITIESNSLLSEQVYFRMYDLVGRLMMEEKISQRINQYSLDLQALPAGIYMLEIENNEEYSMQRVIKN